MNSPALYKIDVCPNVPDALLVVTYGKEVIGYCNLVDDARAIIAEHKAVRGEK
jgi:hypothetical protein